MTEASTAILVVGMHRSGTSALTRVLNLCGVALGANLMPAAEGNNESGFWEHMEAVDINQRLLNHLGRNWWDTRRMPADWLDTPIARASRARIAEFAAREFAGSPLWAVKDPRICRLLPLWINGLRDAGVALRLVFMLRHPAEVAASLNRRDGLSEAETAQLLLSHFFEAAQASAGLPRAVLTYDALLQDWRGCIDRIGNELGLALETEETPEAVAAQVEAFLNPAARHHRAAGDEPADAPSLNAQVFRLGAAAADSAAFWRDADALVAQWERCSNDLLPYVEELLGLLAAQHGMLQKTVPTEAGEAGPAGASPMTRLQFRMITGLREGVGQLHQIAADLGAMVRMGNEATAAAAADLAQGFGALRAVQVQGQETALAQMAVAAGTLDARYEALLQRDAEASVQTRQRQAEQDARLEQTAEQAEQQALARHEQLAAQLAQLAAGLDALRLREEQRDAARWSQRLRRLFARG